MAESDRRRNGESPWRSLAPGTKKVVGMTTRLPHHVRAPGDGADRPDATHQGGRYVYVARSRRSGGLSLGIDLTPDGHCSFSCVYCQASHPVIRNPDLQVDVGRVRDDLLQRLREDRGGELKDIVLAGAGEPTSVPNLGEALEAIQDVCATLHLDLPLRIFTNGRHLGREETRASVARWCERGGEVWVKLDGASEDTLAIVNGRRFDVADHLRTIWSFAREHAIGVQSMLLRGPGIPPVEQVFEEVAGALDQGLASGAKVFAVHLLTLSRLPADERAAEVLDPVGDAELESMADVLRERTGLPVSVFPA